MMKARLAHFVTRRGLHFLLERSCKWEGLVVLNYHRIGDKKGSLFDRGLWSADAETFDQQIGVCRTHLDMLKVGDLPEVLSRGRGRYGLITFDDGYRDNYEVAFPVLKRHGVSAVFFVSTGFIDEPRIPWWDEIAWMVRTSTACRIHLPGWLEGPVLVEEPDREAAVRTLLRVYKTLRSELGEAFLNALAEATGNGRCSVKPSALWMTWNALREMQSAGMAIGGHTVTHPVLARESHGQQREEILGCGRRLALELGTPMRLFSYPVGGRQAFDAVTRECLKEAGVQYAFSYYGGFGRFRGLDAYDIPRVAIETDLTAGWFQSIVRLPQFFA